MKSFNAKQTFIFLGLFLFPLTLFAGLKFHPYLGASAGIAWVQLGTSNSIIRYDGGFFADGYPANRDQQTMAILGVNGGVEISEPGTSPAMAFGIGAYGTPGNYDYTGQVNESILGGPPTLFYNYKYKITTSRLMAEARYTWLIEPLELAPFIDLGIGSAWTRLSGYQESPTAGTIGVTLPPFHSNTNNNFVYQLGAGISYAFNFSRCPMYFKHERISLGYRYVDLGNTSFGIRYGAYPYKLNTGDLTSNELYLNYTHVF